MKVNIGKDGNDSLGKHLIHFESHGRYIGLGCAIFLNLAFSQEVATAKPANFVESMNKKDHIKRSKSLVVSALQMAQILSPIAAQSFETLFFSVIFAAT